MCNEPLTWRVEASQGARLSTPTNSSSCSRKTKQAAKRRGSLFRLIPLYSRSRPPPNHLARAQLAAGWPGVSHVSMAARGARETDATTRRPKSPSPSHVLDFLRVARRRLATLCSRLINASSLAGAGRRDGPKSCMFISQRWRDSLSLSRMSRVSRRRRRRQAPRWVREPRPPLRVQVQPEPAPKHTLTFTRPQLARPNLTHFICCAPVNIHRAGDAKQTPVRPCAITPLAPRAAHLVASRLASENSPSHSAPRCSCYC